MIIPDPHLVIAPEGTTATVFYFDDSYSHDGTEYTYTVHVKFSDPALNPPLIDADKFGWEAGSVTCHYKKFDPEMAWEVGRKFYDFLMAFRTAYAEEERINFWQRICQSKFEENKAQGRTIQDLRDQLKLRDKRIAELETDYTKKLERQVRLLRDFIARIERESLLISKLFAVKKEGS